MRSVATSLGAQPAVATAGALIGLAIVSALLRAALSYWVHGPFFFLDELGYEQMARSFAHTGHFAIFGKSGLAYSPLYPIVLSPIYALTSSPHFAYEWVKVVNAVLMSLSVFPVYAIARFVLTRRQSLAVAALALVAPLVTYSALEVSENLAYPLFLIAVWTLLRALRDPRPRNDAVLLGAILLASGARLQAVVLIPAALTASMLVAVRAARTGEGAGAFRSMLIRHRLLFAAVGVGLVAVVVRMAMNGGAVPLAGRYAAVGHARPPLWDVAKTAVQHLAALDLALAVIPFACALAAGYALARSGFRGQAFMWAAVATATTFWLLLEVGFDAAAFDKTSRLPTGQLTGDLPRIHERYLIYIVPFFLVALVAMTRRGRPNLSPRAHVGVAVTAALLPALVPFARDINYTSVAESPSLQVLGTVKNGVVVPSHPPDRHRTRAFLSPGGRLPPRLPRSSAASRLRCQPARLRSDLVLRDRPYVERCEWVDGRTAAAAGLGRPSGQAERRPGQRHRNAQGRRTRDGLQQPICFSPLLPVQALVRVELRGTAGDSRRRRPPSERNLSAAGALRGRADFVRRERFRHRSRPHGRTRARGSRARSRRGRAAEPGESHLRSLTDVRRSRELAGAGRAARAGTR